MGRQKTKISDRFGSGGNKDGSPEEKFFTDPDIQIDPEWKAMELLRSQIDDITDVINANDASSGSFAGDIKTLYVTSQSFSSRVTTNDAKTGITSTQAGHITTNNGKKGISDDQSSAITANTAKVSFNKKAIATNTADHAVAFTVTNNRGTYALVITMTDSSGRTKVVKTATIALE